LSWVGANAKEKHEKDRIHPTQKPVALYRWILNNYAKPGMRLLDTHVGSASSLIAFEEQGFEYVAFEKDADYYRDSTERIANWRKQGNLFTPQEIRNTMVQKNLFEDEQF
jgi:site-specific DNA-methyltransferase (adenine-specific)